ncbi:MAG: ABC-type sugar transport system maltose-binding protein [Candidatus Phytoplasma cynodontis]|nr:MAG: ABC-type sugar transport system maltose-binding protein [Candidatus Phytoplasma cynodontis]
MVLKVSLKDFLIVTVFFLTIVFFIIIDNYLRPKLNIKKIQKDYLDLEKIIKSEFKNEQLQKNYFKNKKVKIIFWHNLYPREQIFMNKAIKEFQVKFPNIEVVNLSKGNWSQISKSISNSLPINKQPHLSFSYPDHVQFYSKSNKIIPLNIFMENDEDFFNNEKDQFFSSFLPEISLSENKDNKNFFFFPFAKTTEVMFYNNKIIKKIKNNEIQDSDLKKILDEKINPEGIIISPLEWEDLRIICSAIKKDKEKEKDFIPIIIESESNFFIIDNEQRNQIPLPSDKKEAQNFFNNPQIKDKIIYFKEKFIDKGLLTTTKLSGEGNLQEFFKEQKSCFFISSSRRCSTLINNNFNPEITSFPAYCSDNTSSEKYCNNKFLLQGANINLFYSDNKDEMLASWLFLKYLTSKELCIKMIQEKMGIVFSRKDVKQHFLKEKAQNEQNIQKIKQDLKDNKFSEKEKLEKNNTLLHYKFMNFILTLKENLEYQKIFFSTPSYDKSSFFRQILSESFIEILSINNSKKSYDLKKEIDILLKETIQRISSE